MNIDELFIDVDKLPQPLEQEELYSLMKAAKEGSKEALDKVIIHNIRLVLREVHNKFRYVDYDKKDLVSIGILGLIKAIKAYDLSKEFKLSTYAVKCIDNEILYFLKKLKKDQHVDSLDRVIFSDKDGNELKLMDRLSDDSDLVEDYENEETNWTIREVIKKLPNIDKKIVMLYFGFYNNKTYFQSEIADILGINQVQVSRIIKINKKKIKEALESNGVIKLDYKNGESKKKENNIKAKNIYEYFKDYSREQVNEMLTKLTEEERALVTTRYGEDLDNLVLVGLSEEDSYKYYGLLVPKMKRMLKNPTKRNKRLQTIYEYFKDYSREQINEMLTRLTEKDKALITIRYGEDLDNPISLKMTKKERYKFYTQLVPRMRRMLNAPNKEAKKLPTIYEYFKDYPKEQINEVLEKLSEADKAVLKTRFGDDLDTPVSVKLTKDEIYRFYNLLVPKMKRMLNKIGGYSKLDSNGLPKTLASMTNENIKLKNELAQKEQEIEMLKNELLFYKDKLNSLLDSTIEATPEPVVKGRVLSLNHK